MKTLIVLVLIGIGCGSAPITTDAAPTACTIAPSAVIGYQDCGGSTKDGYHCFETCGEIDGGLLVGCLVGQAETPVPALCVVSCAECQ